MFARVITDESFRFDEIRPGYAGSLYLEVVPLSFTVRVSSGPGPHQLRLSLGQTTLTDQELHETHAREPLLFAQGAPVPDDDLATSQGVFLGLDLPDDADGRVGAAGGRIPPGSAGAMAAYDPTSGELRTHYAGFFDLGSGYERSGDRTAPGPPWRSGRTTSRSPSSTASGSASSPSSGWPRSRRCCTARPSAPPTRARPTPWEHPGKHFRRPALSPEYGLPGAGPRSMNHGRRRN